METKNLFIPYELAVIAKEKGFDQWCFAEYSGYNKELYLLRAAFSTPLDCPAPLYQQIVDRFREEHNILIGSDYQPTRSCGWIKTRSKTSSIYDFRWINTDGDDQPRYSYYEALNAAIKEAFKLI